MPRKKILFVDDEETLCRMLKLNLEQTGDYEVMTESRGKYALSAALQFQPKLIILDLIMPDIDGTEVAIQLQENSITKDIPIIFLTAVATKSENQSYDIIRGRYVLAKPVPLDELIAAIEKHL